LSRFVCLSDKGEAQARNQRGGNRAISLRNFHKPVYLLGAATSHIILTPPKISVGCGPGEAHVF